MGLSLEIYMEKIGRNLVCNSFYIESEVVANISDSNTTNRLKKKVRCNYINNIRQWMVWFISILCFKSA